MPDSTPFPNNSARLFGRTPDIQFLLERVTKPGITFVSGRPRMGKTWLLQEVGRRLVAAEPGLVGYYECLQTEPSIFLRATGSLYSTWILKTGMLAQAKVLWSQYRDEFITTVGQAVGRAFEAVESIANPAYGTVAQRVNDAFDALAKANVDLKQGITLAPLDFTQADELLKIMHRLAGNSVPIVLILDAWEKSTALSSEYHILRSFLDHRADWAPLHVLVGLRQPELSEGKNDTAFGLGCDLCKSLPGTVAIHNLPAMDLSAPEEQSRVTAWAEMRLPEKALKNNEADLVGLIQGYPGVIEFWDSAAQRGDIPTWEDMRALAESAHIFRHREFDTLLSRYSNWSAVG